MHYFLYSLNHTLFSGSLLASMLDCHLQNESNLGNIPALDEFEKWVKVSLQKDYKQLEQLIRIVEHDEIQSLNQQYRNKDSTTNILSFPAEQYDFLDYDCLGDLVICSGIIEQEAKAQNKALIDHWAHLVIHGMLHLQGFDHINESDAQEMETLEIKILETIGISNPYND